MSFKELSVPVKFELEEVFSYGVSTNKFGGGYSIPIAVDEETAERISELVKEHNTKDPLYGETLYLKTKALSVKQKKELFKKGKTNIFVHFQATGIYTMKDVNHIVFKVTKLRKLDTDVEDEAPED